MGLNRVTSLLWNRARPTFRGAVRKVLRKRRYLVQIDTTDGCNLRCAFCTRRNVKPSQMTASDFDTILKKLDGRISSLQLSCAWEYSIAKNAPEILLTLGRHSIPTTTIYTNGNILTGQIADALIQSKLDYFVVSIGESTKATYEKIRTGGRFERVISNIRKLHHLKRSLAVTHPKICANLTLINSNIGELPSFVDLARELGITEIRGRHLILNKGLDMAGEVIGDTENANRLIEDAASRAQDYGIDFFVPGYPSERVSKNCTAPWDRLYISANGDVSVCPRIHRYETIGNLIDLDLRRLLRSPRLKALRAQFERGSFENPVCGICMENRETEIEIEQGY